MKGKGRRKKEDYDSQEDDEGKREKEEADLSAPSQRRDRFLVTRLGADLRHK